MRCLGIGLQVLLGLLVRWPRRMRMAERLNKFLAERLGLSRREADDAIAAGRVLLNDSVAVLGARVDKNDKVCYNGKQVSDKVAYIYIAFHKPVGYVCSRRAQGDAPTIYNLLPANFQALKTVGRLDKNSSGLILLTNDGDFAYQMTHPRFVKHKVYEVRLDRALEPLHQQMIADYGVTLPDGPSRLGLTKLSDARDFWQVEMSEGRNRQIRRTFAALGYQVVALHRKQFGNYGLGDLAEGKFEKVARA